MSELRVRLARLRRETGNGSGSQPGAAPAADTCELRRRLQRVHASSHRIRRLPTPTPLGDDALAEHLGGRVLSDGLVAVEETIPLGTAHGRGRLGHDIAPALCFFGAKATSDSAYGEDGAVFMDTETTGLSGGTGTLVFLLGLARRTPHALEITQLFLTGFRGEPAMLETAGRIVGGARVLVSYNGKSFDHPLLSDRYRLAGLPDPFAALEHIDLLHATRRAFGKQWGECTLRAAERRLLAFRREDDIPGADIPEAWFRWVRRGAAADLGRVVRHNRWDVVTLVAVLPILQRCYEAPGEDGADAYAVARHYRRCFDDRRAYAYLRAHRAHLGADGLLELARLGRRYGEGDLALAVWEELGTAGNTQALECLAKHHEHAARDPARALALTRELVAREPLSAAHRHREARLRAKLSRKKDHHRGHRGKKKIRVSQQ
ncbi:MAG: ribonuclease H-like domain-containing protein [Gammaproteobacteria bacterium]|nr:ribonuclease H-like domain-containing protein [Gammaproteobacteria bacterium]NIR85298.1 ribonuclease H-like domain-containing protein [Gammaproteobacteria bacterium]NIR88414.1 ribonuclease H-like domain-containing protein [Gammaproteobacteria bacterium]NIU06364.1 ribonuclease H-like domain-containing protein [Gammaproteobacteria bacterium]NIV53263.1 hypothetical protein [Gammaproteobacteria bacterium]